MSEKDQMERLAKVALQPTKSVYDYASRESAVDAVAAFGVAAIPVLIEISEKSEIGSVKKKATEWIAKIKSSSDKSTRLA